MKLLGSFKPQDVDSTFIEDFPLSEYKIRKAGRAIILDGEKVAVIHVGTHGYYMLPGGGIDDGEDIKKGLEREIAEELGETVEIGKEVGLIEIFNDRWRSRQIDHCYFGNLLSFDARDDKTEFEQSEGHSVVWAENIQEAIKLLQEAVPENRDGKLIRARDLLFLQTALNL